MIVGRGYLGLKQPNQQVAVVAQTVCGESIVNEYTGIINAAEGIGANALVDLVKKITNKGGPGEDAVCHYVILHDASLRGDKGAIDGLHEKFLQSLKSRQAVEQFYNLGITKQNAEVMVQIGKEGATQDSQDGSAGEG